jgi:hypothetical protein
MSQSFLLCPLGLYEIVLEKSLLLEIMKKFSHVFLYIRLALAQDKLYIKFLLNRF